MAFSWVSLSVVPRVCLSPPLPSLPHTPGRVRSWPGLQSGCDGWGMCYRRHERDPAFRHKLTLTPVSRTETSPFPPSPALLTCSPSP